MVRSRLISLKRCKYKVPKQNYYLKLLNMCKFAHDRKTQNIKYVL